MTESEYQNTEKIALDLVDWLFTKTRSSHIILTVLMRSLCLFLAQSRKKSTSSAEMSKAFTKAFEQETRDADAFVSKQKGGA